MAKITLRNVPGIHSKDVRIGEALRDTESHLTAHKTSIDEHAKQITTLNAQTTSQAAQIAALQKLVAELQAKVK